MTLEVNLWCLLKLNKHEFLLNFQKTKWWAALRHHELLIFHQTGCIQDIEANFKCMNMSQWQNFSRCWKYVFLIKIRRSITKLSHFFDTLVSAKKSYYIKTRLLMLTRVEHTDGQRDDLKTLTPTATSGRQVTWPSTKAWVRPADYDKQLMS